MSAEMITADTASRPPYINMVINPPTSTPAEDIPKAQAPVPVYSTSPPKYKFVSYETMLGRSPAMTTCTSCRQQVMTSVSYKAGAYACLICLVFIFCGLFFGCCLIPFFVKRFKDVYHSCPRCNRILHIERPSCCSLV